MMIPIKSEKGQLSEWAIIELQGNLMFESIDSSGISLIGDLHYTKTGTPIFIIGMHILYGKAINLPKPIAVLEKSSQTNKEPDTLYAVKAVIRKKLIFKVRPKPIITNVPKSR